MRLSFVLKNPDAISPCLKNPDHIISYLNILWARLRRLKPHKYFLHVGIFLCKTQKHIYPNFWSKKLESHVKYKWLD